MLLIPFAAKHTLPTTLRPTSPSSSRKCTSLLLSSFTYVFLLSGTFRSLSLKHPQALENIAAKTPLDCLALFRQLMVDVIVSTSYGYRLGAVSKWAMNAVDPLSTAINDFPKRGILVRFCCSYYLIFDLSLCLQRSAVPTWAWDLICKIPSGRWRQLCDSDKIMAEVCCLLYSEFSS